MKNFIKAILIIFLFTVGFTAFAQKDMLPNPSAVYVRFLGYKYEARTDSSGNAYAACIFPDGTECNAWSFYRGICGQKFSYCALKGCLTKTKIENNGSYNIQYAVCSCKDSTGTVQDIPLNVFMEQHGDTLITYDQRK